MRNVAVLVTIRVGSILSCTRGEVSLDIKGGVTCTTLQGNDCGAALGAGMHLSWGYFL